MSPRRGTGSTKNGPTIEAAFGGLLGFVPGYLFMESIFRPYPHPSHWAGALIGTGVDYGLGALVAARKEGRPPFGPGRERRAGSGARSPGKNGDRAEKRERP